MSRSRSAAVVAAIATTALAGTAAAEGPKAGPDATYPVLDIEFPVQSLDRSVTRTDRAITLAADVLFAFNSARLGPKAGPRINQAVAEIESAGAKSVQVVGHTDNKGSPGFNVALSRRRAAAVEDVLADRLGDGVRLTISGKGESDPVAANQLPDGSDSPKGRALNRRVEILIPRR
jgi:outer membrane protein OmpA-like peptidoglycan-associated protein